MCLSRTVLFGTGLHRIRVVQKKHYASAYILSKPHPMGQVVERLPGGVGVIPIHPHKSVDSNPFKPPAGSHADACTPSSSHESKAVCAECVGGQGLAVLESFSSWFC